MAVQNYRDLRVWQAAMAVVRDVYSATHAFPKSERYGLASQIQRAAVSIPSNIAEGNAREHRKEYLNHLSIAQGSLAELSTQLEIAGGLSYLSPDQTEGFLGRLNSLSRQLYALRNALQER